MKHVLIAEDHEIFRRGLKDILKEEFSGVKFADAGDGRAALEAARSQSFDLILLDINLPGRSGLDILQELKTFCPDTPVLVVSLSPEEDYAVRAFKLGASGYLTKKSATDELLAAVRKVLGGGRYVTSSLAERLAAALTGDAPSAPHEALSNRELQVLRRIASGRTIKEIAAELNLSEKTIGTYRTRISDKLALSTNVELTRYAIAHQLTD
ncbi:MAG TPA: response regulator transcription factor [Verrucomicrobiae bacterium]|jgi:two-component system invasion response regulator UvrY|nr:response regulator transcription factor [Verrucomicrobiae bacterium]